MTRKATGRLQGLVLGALAVAAFAGLGGQAHASEDTAVARAAMLWVSVIEPRGYDTFRNEDSDVLNQGQTMTYTVTLYGGVSYVLFAAGDENIRDLDISLYDENGNLIDRDTSTDNIPVVSVTPKWTGSFKLNVRNYAGRRGWYHMAIAH